MGSGSSTARLPILFEEERLAYDSGLAGLARAEHRNYPVWRLGQTADKRIDMRSLESAHIVRLHH